MENKKADLEPNREVNQEVNQECYQWINGDEIYSFINKSDFVNFTLKQRIDNPHIFPRFKYPKSLFDNIL